MVVSISLLTRGFPTQNHPHSCYNTKLFDLLTALANQPLPQPSETTPHDFYLLSPRGGHQWHANNGTPYAQYVYRNGVTMASTVARGFANTKISSAISSFRRIVSISFTRALSRDCCDDGRPEFMASQSTFRFNLSHKQEQRSTSE